MGKIIAVASGKGGTGKTSFTACVGLSLAAMGYETLALDCDITLRNLDLALGLSDSAAMDFSDVLEGRCTLEEAAVRHRKYPKLSLLAAPLAPVGARFSQTAMQALGQAIRQQYDYCLIDAPAGLGEGFQLATAIADSVIVVTTTDPAALRDAQRTVMELRRFPAGQVHLVEPGAEENAEGTPLHHRRRHGHGGPSPAGRDPGGRRHSAGPEPGHPLTGYELLRPTGL